MFTRVPPATLITQIVFDHFTDIDVNLTRWALDHLTPPIKAFAPAEERPAGKLEKT
jgi:hypothetical protein